MSALLKPSGLKVSPASATSMTVTWGASGPNLVPSDAAYVANAYTLTGLIPGKRYVWKKGAAETYLINGVNSYTNDSVGDAPWNGGTVYFTAAGSSVIMGGASASGAVLGTLRETEQTADVLGDGNATCLASGTELVLYEGPQKYLNGILFELVPGRTFVELEFRDDGTVTTDDCVITQTGGADFLIKIKNNVTRTATVAAEFLDFLGSPNAFFRVQASGIYGTGTTGNFEVFRDGVLVQTVSAATLSLADTGLTQLTHYGYQVRAVDTNGNASEFSAPAGCVTPSSTTNPGFPVAFGAGVATAVTVDGSGNVFTVGYLSKANTYFTFLCKIDTNGNLVWCKCFPGALSGGLVGVDSAGSIIVTGQFRGTVDFGSGPISSGAEADVIIAKFSNSGLLTRSIVIDVGAPFLGAGDDTVYSMVIDSANAIIVGMTQNTGAGLTPVISKYTTDLALVWRKQWAHAGDVNNVKVGVDSANNVLVGAQFAATVNPGLGTLTSAGGSDIVIAKLDGTNGTPIWQNRQGDIYTDGMRALAVDSGNNVLIAGIFFHVADLGGGQIGNNGLYNAYVAKYDTNGAHVWSKAFTGVSGIRVSTISLGTSDVVFVGGQNYGLLTFGSYSHYSADEYGYIGKYSSGGAEQSLVASGKVVYGLDAAPSNNLVAVGHNADANVFVARVAQ